MAEKSTRIHGEAEVLASGDLRCQVFSFYRTCARLTRAALSTVAQNLETTCTRVCLYAPI